MIKKIATKDRKEWLKLRHKYIGGSDSAACVGMNPFSSPYSLWAEKTGRIEGFKGNMATKVGTYLEPFVADLWAEHEGKKVRRCNLSMINDKYPWAIANVDRLVVGEDAGLEIKTTSELMTSRFKGGEFPPQYYCQCVHYMAVTEKARWYLAVLIGNKELKVFTIERDEEEIQKLMEAEKDLWDHIQSDTPPAPDGSEATTRTLGQIYEDNGLPADLSCAMDYVQIFQQLSEREKEVKAQKDEAANHIKDMMGDASYGTCGEFKVSWKAQTRKSLNKKRLLEQWPEIDLEEFMDESTSRVFRVK